MKSRYSVFVCLGIMLVCAGYFAGKYVARPAADTSTSPASKNGSSIDAGHGIATQVPAPTVSLVQASGGRYVPAEQYCRGDRECLRSPLTARSEADYAWLRQHGYPTREDLERFASMSDSQLQYEAETGALPAMVAWSDRLIANGDPARGFDLLIAASNRGSVYAYYITSAHTLNRKPMGGRVEAAAFLRLAYLLGDDMASNEFYSRYGDYSPVELAAVDARAASLYRTYAQNRSRSPRPQE